MKIGNRFVVHKLIEGVSNGIMNVTIKSLTEDKIEAVSRGDHFPYPNYGGKDDPTTYYLVQPMDFYGPHHEIEGFRITHQTSQRPFVATVEFSLTGHIETPIKLNKESKGDKESE